MFSWDLAKRPIATRRSFVLNQRLPTFLALLFSKYRHNSVNFTTRKYTKIYSFPISRFFFPSFFLSFGSNIDTICLTFPRRSANKAFFYFLFPSWVCNIDVIISIIYPFVPCLSSYTRPPSKWVLPSHREPLVMISIIYGYLWSLLSSSILMASILY